MPGSCDTTVAFGDLADAARRRFWTCSGRGEAFAGEAEQYERELALPARAVKGEPAVLRGGAPDLASVVFLCNEASRGDFE
jgi:hypothetical protein